MHMKIKLSLQCLYNKKMEMDLKMNDGQLNEQSFHDKLTYQQKRSPLIICLCVVAAAYECHKKSLKFVAS